MTTSARKPKDETAKPVGERRGPPPVFDSSRCKSCGICVAFCPKGVLQEGPEGVPEVTDPQVCNSCRLCRDRCPDFAIEFPDDDQPAEGS